MLPGLRKVHGGCGWFVRWSLVICSRLSLAWLVTNSSRWFCSLCQSCCVSSVAICLPAMGFCLGGSPTSVVFVVLFVQRLGEFRLVTFCAGSDSKSLKGMVVI